MTTTLRERRKQLLREEIISTAQELISLHGYAAMSMDELATRVGISKPTLYGYFASKEEVAIGVAINRAERLHTWLDSQPTHISPFERLLGLLRQLVALDVEHSNIPMETWSPELFRIVCTHQEALEYMRRIHNYVKALVVEAITTGEIDPSLTADTVVLSFYSASGTLKLARITHMLSETTPLETVDAIITIFARGVQNPAHTH